MPTIKSISVDLSHLSPNLLLGFLIDDARSIERVVHLIETGKIEGEVVYADDAPVESLFSRMQREASEATARRRTPPPHASVFGGNLDFGSIFAGFKETGSSDIFEKAPGHEATDGTHSIRDILDAIERHQGSPKRPQSRAEALFGDCVQPKDPNEAFMTFLNGLDAETVTMLGLSLEAAGSAVEKMMADGIKIFNGGGKPAEMNFSVKWGGDKAANFSAEIAGNGAALDISCKDGAEFLDLTLLLKKKKRGVNLSTSVKTNGGNQEFIAKFRDTPAEKVAT